MERHVVILGVDTDKMDGVDSLLVENSLVNCFTYNSPFAAREKVMGLVTIGEEVLILSRSKVFIREEAWHVSIRHMLKLCYLEYLTPVAVKETFDLCAGL